MIHNIESSLLNYENYKKGIIIYDNVDIFIDNNPDINNNTIIYLINWPCGFGSALTVFMQNAYYLHSIYNNIHILPMFSDNSDYFKYSDSFLNNTFFRYFKYNLLPENINIEKYNIYFIKSSPTNRINFFTPIFPPMKNEPAKTYINYFKKYFKLCIGEHIYDYIKNIRNDDTPIIGLHIRSIYQKQIHNSEYASISIKERLLNLKLKLDNIYNVYKIFIASDVLEYINISKNIFNSVYYLKDINRINNENDSIPQLSEFTGFKLGSDIIYDCLALSLCDNVYISNSNIPFIISILNENIELYEY